MRKYICLALLGMSLTSFVAYTTAQTHKKKPGATKSNVNRNLNGNTSSVVEREQLQAIKNSQTNSSGSSGTPKSAIGAGGAGTYARHSSPGHWVTRHGKRIWVPQGSPAKVTNANR
jgi:hypothetical protein